MTMLIKDSRKNTCIKDERNYWRESIISSLWIEQCYIIPIIKNEKASFLNYSFFHSDKIKACEITASRSLNSLVDAPDWDVFIMYDNPPLEVRVS